MNLCSAEMSKETELLLDSYLPGNYAEFTPEQQRLLENRFNVKRLTRELVQSYQKVDEGCAEDDPRHLRLDSSTVVVQALVKLVPCLMYAGNALAKVALQ